MLTQKAFYLNWGLLGLQSKISYVNREGIQGYNLQNSPKQLQNASL